MAERITNGSFENTTCVVPGWTGTGTLISYTTHSGDYALLVSNTWMLSNNLGDIPVADVDSFGFYYQCYHYDGGDASYTVIFSDESNVSNTLPESSAWTYVDLVPQLVEGKNVSALYFTSPQDIELLVDDVSLLTDSVEKVTNGGFDEPLVFSGWTGFGEISDSYAHTGSYSLKLSGATWSPPAQWVLSSDLGGIPATTKRIESFGFYCRSQDFYYKGAVTYTINYTDGTTSSDDISPSTDWVYVDLLPLLESGKNVSAVHFLSTDNDPIWIDDVSLMGDDTPLGWYENVFTISRSDFWIDTSNFTFTAHLYVDSLNQTLDTEMRIIEIHEDETWFGSQTVNVSLYVNSSGTYIHAVGGVIDVTPLGEGYAECALGEWHTIYYEYLYFEENATEHWSFQVDANELFSGDTIDYSFAYDRITLGSWGAPDNISNFTLYYDDIDWTAGSENFEGTFPGDWTTEGSVGLSTHQSVSPTHSLIVPMVSPEGPPAVTLTIVQPENTTYTTGTIPVNLTASDGTIDKIWYNCKNGTDWIYPENQTYTTPTQMTGFVNGTYDFFAWANNTEGSMDSDNVWFTVAIPPTPPPEVTLTIVKPQNTTYTTGTIPVQLTATGGTIDKIWYNAKNATNWVYENNQTYTAPTNMVGFGNGTYVFFAWANNTEGQSDEKNVTFTVAIPPPSVTLTITNPQNTTYTTSTIPVQLSASGGTIDQIWFNCKNGTSWVYSENQTYTPSTSMTNFVDGTYIFYAWANNTDGNSDEATVSFTVGISTTSWPPPYKRPPEVTPAPPTITIPPLPPISVILMCLAGGAFVTLLYVRRKH